MFGESKITFAVVVASHFFPILFSDELQKLSLSRFNNFVSPWKAAAIKHLPWSFDDSEITFSLWSPIISFTIYKLIFKLLDHVFFRFTSKIHEQQPTGGPLIPNQDRLTSKCPETTAWTKGVTFCLSEMFIVCLHQLIILPTICWWPNLAAKCKGVCPLLSCISKYVSNLFIEIIWNEPFILHWTYEDWSRVWQ